MGKKKDKKGKGKEKTEQKTEKKAAKRAKKELAEKGEDDIEQMIAEFVAKDKCLTQVMEEKCPPPSPRCNMTLVAHPDKEELIMFGGECYTGKQMFLYNDLFFYNIRKNDWLKVTSPNAPPPRSVHQSVTLAQGGGQMWVFGGEFSSHSQNQFYHYRDLWLLHLKDKKWEQVTGTGRDKTCGPSARSGHRMVAFKNQLIMFGGFHDNSREIKYFNDLWSFDFATYAWTQLSPVGNGPSPRSGCVLFPSLTGSRLLVYGGYSMEKVKRDVDQGTTHIDMFALQPEGKGADGKPAKWRWMPVKQSGSKPTPRCSMSAVVAPGNQGVVFGGVHDEEEDEEQLEGTFFNDMFTLDLDKAHWYTVKLRGNKQSTEKKRRRKKTKEVEAAGGASEGGEDDDDDDEMETDDENDDMDVPEEDLENLALDAEKKDRDAAGSQTNASNNKDCTTAEEAMTVAESAEPTQSTSSTVDDVFQVTVGPQSSGGSREGASKSASAGAEDFFVPCGRMKPCLAVKNGVLFLYGGTFEEGDKQVTLGDFYCLDLGKLDEWKTIIAQDAKQANWQESGSESEEEDSKDKDRKRKVASRTVEEDSDSDDDDSDDELTFDDAPAREDEESKEDYFSRTTEYWIKQAKDIMEGEGIQLSDRKLLKLAKEICEEASS